MGNNELSSRLRNEMEQSRVLGILQVQVFSFVWTCRTKGRGLVPLGGLRGESGQEGHTANGGRHTAKAAFPFRGPGGKEAGSTGRRAQSVERRV